MATKTSILASINAEITAIITQAKHRLSMSFLVDELYPTEYEITETVFNILPATTIDNVNTTDFDFAIKIKKVGNTVFINGTITNATATILGGTRVVFNVTGEFAGLFSEVYISTTNILGGNAVGLFIDDNGLRLFGTFTANGIISFNGTYTTNT